MKSMADFLGISSSHLSGIEYGEKTLVDKFIAGTVRFFSGSATADELRELRDAGEQSKDMVNIKELQPDARRLVAAFARRLQDGGQPTDEIKGWLDSRFREDKPK
jgi:hypothetical protein